MAEQHILNLKPDFHLQFSITKSINIHGAMHRRGVDFFSVGLWHTIVNKFLVKIINRLTHNDPYMGRTATLTSKRCILYIYSTKVGTEYFKHALYSPFFLFKMQFVS